MYSAESLRFTLTTCRLVTYDGKPDAKQLDAILQDYAKDAVGDDEAESAKY